MNKNSLSNLDLQYIAYSAYHLVDNTANAFFEIENLAENGQVDAIIDMLLDGHILGKNAMEYLKSISKKSFESLSADEAYCLFLASVMESGDNRLMELETELARISMSLIDRVKNANEIQEIYNEIKKDPAVNLLEKATKEYQVLAKSGDLKSCYRLLELSINHPYFCHISDHAKENLETVIHNSYENNKTDLSSCFYFAKTALKFGRSINENLLGKAILEDLASNVIANDTLVA